MGWQVEPALMHRASERFVTTSIFLEQGLPRGEGEKGWADTRPLKRPCVTHCHCRHSTVSRVHQIPRPVRSPKGCAAGG